MLGFSINKLKIATTTIAMATERNRREHDNGEDKERWKGGDLGLRVTGVCACEREREDLR